MASPSRPTSRTTPDSSDVQALRCSVAVGSAYLAQGIIAGVGVSLLSALVQAGTPIEQQAGLLASGAVPWVLKFVFALLLDLLPSWSLRVRATVIAGLQLCAAACLWGLAAAWAERQASGTSSIATITTFWIALNFAAALQDVLVDKLALDTLRGRQAWTAMAMGSGHAIGFGWLGSMVLGSVIADQGLGGGSSTAAGWVAIAGLVCGALLWLPGRPVRTRLPDSDRAGDRTGDRTGREELIQLLVIGLSFMALTFANTATGAISFEFVIGHLEYDALQYMRVVVPLATIAGIVGALAMGPVIAKLGPIRATVIAGVALGSMWLAFAAAEGLWREPAMLPTFAAAEGFLQPALLGGLYAVALVAVARSPLPATAFVLAMAALNLPRVLAPLTTPALLELGWVGVWVASGLFQLLAVAGLWTLRKRIARDG